MTRVQPRRRWVYPFLLLSYIHFFASTNAFSFHQPTVARRRKFCNRANSPHEHHRCRRRHHPDLWLYPVDPEATVDDLQRYASDEYIERVVSQTISYQATSDIIRKYKPERLWLWTRWKGTILQHGSKKALLNMAIAGALCLLAKRGLNSSGGIGGWMVATTEKSFLSAFNKTWHYCMTLTTFVLTFFLTQSFQFWRHIYNLARIVQGRLNDFSLLLATHVKRDASGAYTPEGKIFLDEVSQYIRLLSPFLWASYSRHFRVLLTPRGMKQLVAKQFMTKRQADALVNSNVPRTQYCSICLEWILARTNKAQKDGLFNNSKGLGVVFNNQACVLRGTMAEIGDEVDGRMPLVYTHFVQILVDWFVLGAPLALYLELGSMSVVCVGILTLFYEGLLDLSKVLLDPLENEDYCDGGIEMDLAVLIQEANAGSMRWKKGIETLPFD